jgi:hypothetical protein
MIDRFLQQVIPFRFLTAEQRAALRADLTEVTFAAGEVLTHQGDPEDQRVFLVLEGAVEALDRRTDPPKRVTVVEAGHYFGDRSPLFDTPRALELRAVGPVRCGILQGERFLRLIETSSPFAQALGNILRVKQGIFQPFDRFVAEALHGVTRGDIALRQLVPLYRALEPALHPLANDPQAIDFAALAYAVRRLPANVTRTFLFFLTDNLPPLYREADHSFRPAPSPARRRAAYEMTAGKDLVLLRDGLTDLIDLLTCLCLYAVEARKIRKRLQTTSHLLALQEHLAPGPSGPAAGALTFLRSLSFTEAEVEQLTRVWPGDAAARLYEIVLHHEDLLIEIQKQLDNYNSAHSEEWVEQVAQGVRELLGCDPSELAQEVSVHVISSNTHSVTNCLSPYLAERADAILAWGQRIRPDLAREPWEQREDLLYALSRYYLEAHPEEAVNRQRLERAGGVLRLVETAFTGITVDLIDSTRLAGRSLDPGVTPPPPGVRSLLVNIDFAFGQQAEEIMANLVLLFGRNLASVSVLGKAGGLQGSRGDVLLPTGFIDQLTDFIHVLPAAQAIDIERLRRRVPGRGVHQGPMLTVVGTLLQNRMLLNFYRRLWRCIGLEMEAFFYYRHIRKATQLGVIPSQLPLRFLYYVSDLPLEAGVTLSEPLRASEGIPPLYAITREILSSIFEQEAARGARCLETPASPAPV